VPLWSAHVNKITHSQGERGKKSEGEREGQERGKPKMDARLDIPIGKKPF
jgi:hypothetical protein